MDVIATLMLIVQTALEVTRVHVETDSVEMVLHVPTLMSATTHHVTIMHRVPMNQVASRAVATMDTVEMVLHVQVYVNSMALAQTMQFALWTKSEMSTVTVRVASLGIILSLVLINVTTLMNAKPTHVTLVHLAPTTMVDHHGHQGEASNRNHQTKVHRGLQKHIASHGLYHLDNLRPIL